MILYLHSAIDFPLLTTMCHLQYISRNKRGEEEKKRILDKLPKLKAFKAWAMSCHGFQIENLLSFWSFSGRWPSIGLVANAVLSGRLSQLMGFTTRSQRYAKPSCWSFDEISEPFQLSSFSGALGSRWHSWAWRKFLVPNSTRFVTICAKLAQC